VIVIVIVIMVAIAIMVMAMVVTRTPPARPIIITSGEAEHTHEQCAGDS
jgi:hypothetical protein